MKKWAISFIINKVLSRDAIVSAVARLGETLLSSVEDTERLGRVSALAKAVSKVAFKVASDLEDGRLTEDEVRATVALAEECFAVDAAQKVEDARAAVAALLS